jgi:histone H3/H4
MTQTEDAHVHEAFLDLVPEKGWLRDYVTYTAWSEAPASFHFFTACSVLGAAIGRKAWFSKGYYRVYPNHQIILVAPTGKCRKTSALNLGVKLLQGLEGINLVADKITPEALAGALSATPLQGDKLLAQRPAEGVIYAPELAVFLGKQKYNEGLITLLTALFDNPDKWQTSTKSGGNVELNEVCLTFMGASTPDWLITAIPQDAFGGGFMSRLLFVVEDDTPRCFAIPKVQETPDKLIKELAAIRALKEVGELSFANQATLDWYKVWYAQAKSNIPEDEKMAGYHERKPDHLLRMAMLMAMSQGRRTVTKEDLLASLAILQYMEKQMLSTFKWLGVKPIGVDQERILRTLKAHDNRMLAKDLLRTQIFYMNAVQFKLAVETLEQAGMLRVGLDPATKQIVYLLAKPEK